MGAPLTALHKKSGGFRPIAVGEVLLRLTSRVCCSAVKPRLSEVFLPYGQVGVGTKGGLEAAVHTARTFIQDYGQDENFCCLKIDMKKCFQRMQSVFFLRRLNQEFPELLSWAKWCYCSAGELRFGNCRLTSTTGVQQGDPLDPLLFSLVVLAALDNLGHIDGLQMQKLWYLDDGTFFGSQDALSVLLKSLLSRGPDVSLHINLAKCEVFWPSGDQKFPSFPPEIHRLCMSSNGVELLGSSIFRSHEFFDNFFKSRIAKVRDAQDRLADLDNPQIALHLLRSCLSLSKISYLLRTVPPGSSDS